MVEHIFRKESRRFWNRNLPVIPVEGKVPILPGWQGQLGALPTEEKRTLWQNQYGDNNIGLLTGFDVGDGKIFVGLDVDDDRLLNVSLQILGLSNQQRRVVLSGKRGKKGATIFARAVKALKSTVIKGAGGLGNIDVLAAGKMTVMPPSVHPDTRKPYEVLGEPILNVDFANLPEITEHQIKLMKVTLGSEHAFTLTMGESTHDAGVALVATLVRTGATDEEIANIFVGLLPRDYSGNSLDELPGWIASARAKGFGNLSDEDAPTLTHALVSLALNAGIELFNDGDGAAFATLPHTGSAVAYRIKSDAFKQWLRHQAYVVMEKAVNSTPLMEAVATIETKALFDGLAYPVFARVAGDDEIVLIDIGASDGRVVKIDKIGWSVEGGSRLKFVRGAGFESLPTPEEGGNLFALKDFLGLDEHNFRLLAAFLINALKPHGPYFVLLVEGEQGSGKSVFCEIVKRVIDPNKAMRLRLPDKPQDLMIQAKEYRLLSFDNASGMKAEMSDVLCTLATGGGIAVRKLYSDGDIHVMSYTRPFIMNGIAGYANRPDLMERAIPIRLVPMQEGGRRTEAELLAEFAELLPGILGALYDAVARGLENFSMVEPPRHLRMADAAKWIKAAESALKLENGSLIDAIAKAQDDFVIEKVNEDPLVTMLRLVCRNGPFEGYAIELFAEFRERRDSVPEHALPKTASHLSNQLKRMRPAMAKAGVHVEYVGKDRKGMKIRVSLDGGYQTAF
ncbi:bifunctional DNA primase/polymerase [Ensifer sp. PDNC004]|uniref:bifunctional DNA primase/polymerase n=1 Tax=Ensifer sp. PDNC004 TaxID=2811423 RepID=UPI0019635BC8|nr:bifunctional DNA primase/polymerase [Ensifer sp. PDNC004]QRY67285.1 bifunctional DNA primase/polymerase [Ensifer sp. PDNC004]